MPILTWVFISVLVALAGAWGGVVFGQGSRKQLETLVHIAAGALLAIATVDILPEAKAALSWPAFVAASIGGFGTLLAISRYVHDVCPACSLGHHEEEALLAHRASLALLAVALGIHCVMDGLAISAGGHLGSAAEFGALAAVIVHKLPEGIALGALLVGARYPSGVALWIAGGIEASTMLGGALGLLPVMNPTPTFVGGILAVVGGGFVFLVANTLVGAFTHPMQLPRSKGLTFEVAAFAATSVLFVIAERL